MEQNIALSIEDVQAVTGLGRTKIYELLKTGELRARKIGHRTLILKEDLDTFLTGLKPYPSKREGA